MHTRDPIIQNTTNLQKEPGGAPRESKLCYTTLDKPIAELRWPGPKGKLKLKCGKCDQWVGCNGRSSATSRQSFLTHQTSQDCLDIASRVVDSLEPDLSPKPPVQSAWPRSHHICPGIPLVWPSDQFHASYLWHLHDVGHPFRAKITWKICGIDEINSTFYVRSLLCNLLYMDPTSPCSSCVSVTQDIEEMHRLVTMQAPNASYGHRPWLRVREQVQSLKKDNSKLGLEVCLKVEYL
jgi:hypothetical protein